MPAIGMSLAAVTSARSFKPRTVKRSATMSITHTLRHGAIVDRMRRLSWSRSHSSFIMFIPARGVTSNEINVKDLAAEKPQRAGQVRPVRHGQGRSGNVDAGMPGRAE